MKGYGDIEEILTTADRQQANGQAVTAMWLRDYVDLLRKTEPAADAGQAVAWKCRDCDWVGTSNNCANNGGHEVFPLAHTHPARRDAGAADEDVVRDAKRWRQFCKMLDSEQEPGTISAEFWLGDELSEALWCERDIVERVDAAIATAAPVGEARTASSPDRGVAK